MLPVQPAVGSRDFNPHNFNPRVSDPRAAACLQFKMPFGSSNLPGAGPICEGIRGRASNADGFFLRATRFAGSLARSGASCLSRQNVADC